MLLPTQYRETVRKSRNLVARRDATNRVLAELAIDSTAFRFNEPQDVWHYEVEVEVKSEGGLIAVRQVHQELIELTGGKLRPWPHGKFLTGKAISRLLREGHLADHLDSEGTLRSSAYELIARDIVNIG